MTFVDFINYLTGCTEFETESPEPEKFLTKCLDENYDIWGIRRLDACTLRFRCRLIDRKGIHTLAEICGADQISEVPTGLPIKIKKSRHRLGFLIGAALFLIMLILLSSFVWKIEITGYEDYSQLIKTEEVLKKSGLTVGSLRSFQDYQALRRNLMQSLDFISGATVNIRGSIAEIELETAKMPPPEENMNPSNIIANEDAQIIRIFNRSGVPVVKENDIVQKGQLLVSGVYDSNRIGFRLVHARALIEARVTRKLSVFVPYEEQVLLPTGKEETKYSLSLFGKTFFDPKTKFNEFEKTSGTDYLTFGDNLVFPFALTHTLYTEQQDSVIKRSKEEAFEEAKKRLDEKESIGMKNLEIEAKEIKHVYSKKGVYVEYVYSVITEIGEDREIYNTAG